MSDLSLLPNDRIFPTSSWTSLIASTRFVDTIFITSPADAALFNLIILPNVASTAVKPVCCEPKIVFVLTLLPLEPGCTLNAVLALYVPDWFFNLIPFVISHDNTFALKVTEACVKSVCALAAW
jgi:hypothetical protein